MGSRGNKILYITVTVADLIPFTLLPPSYTAQNIYTEARDVGW